MKNRNQITAKLPLILTACMGLFAAVCEKMPLGSTHVYTDSYYVAGSDEKNEKSIGSATLRINPNLSGNKCRNVCSINYLRGGRDKNAAPARRF